MRTGWSSIILNCPVIGVNPGIVIKDFLVEKKLGIRVVYFEFDVLSLGSDFWCGWSVNYCCTYAIFHKWKVEDFKKKQTMLIFQ